MIQQYKLYLDACCLNRPFDDQTQSRIYLEAQAIITILNNCQSATWKLINSSALIAELNQTPDLERLQNVKKLLLIAKIKVIHSPFIEDRAAELQKLGFSSYDATHIASAERSQADVFLTTDDRLFKKAQINSQLINVKIKNPVQWLAEVIQAEDSNDENPK
ncbi:MULTISPECIES: PIN domain-containing protein [Cyanophyceae]|uniref:PIN domain-containing protein n=1 Tax=Cyanophyceae TaxID=3028117 RepID=UPI00232B1F0A|nr:MULTISPECIES: PIN domain-containing protein [Cyanophyceae]MDB9355827.1 PIN domain-containing protein [Nodularia spumigena CS-587/03]MDB9304501.1 PIN domain-containing protein [Nodularia spumigena CS-591/12]MDB9316404.1 PIN domain-containing protein [Nodularia spumigena CS-590/01A]MDB9321440.1 PIN domain-containing protein [Nodularia spumigena CS-591/07A]MDB9327552.1 PIN domain-containing protein [Nodularia spumigena CS-590/02]